MKKTDTYDDAKRNKCEHDHDHSSEAQLDHGRRNFMLSCGCFALSLSTIGTTLLAETSRAEVAAGGKPLKVGHLPAGCVSHLLLAKKRNMFAKEGLNVELIQFNGPADNLQAMVAGTLQIVHNPWPTTMGAYAQGNNNLRIVGGSGLSGIELVARKGSVKNASEFIAAAGKGLRQ